jgi:hypothetical protein
MLTWTPDNSAEWFTRSEADTSVSETITIASDDATVESVSYVLTPNQLPAQVVITATTSGITLTAPTLAGLFPIIVIKYLRNGLPGESLTFDDLPQDAEDVIEYRKESASPKRFVLAVTATESALSPTSSGTQTLEYEFFIEGNYTPGRDRLVEEVNARR